MSSPKAFTFLPLGALVQDFIVNGKNINQGFPTQELYEEHNSPHFGSNIGRIANRVSGAKINDLNGRSYELAANLPPSTLHGGNVGWGKRIFEGPTTVMRNGKEATLFKYISPDGEEGFPGTIEFRVYYTQEKELVEGVTHEVLTIEYEGELVGDGVEETAINITNHSYFNLTGDATTAGTEVTLFASEHLTMDEFNVPLGPIAPHPTVKSGESFTLATDGPDFDDCFVTNTSASSIPIDTRTLPLTKVAAFFHPTTKIHLEISTTEPAFQFYSGRWVDVPAVGGLPARGARAGFCVEPGRYVNAVNVPEWRGQTVLRRGEVFGAVSVWRGWAT